MVFAAFLVYSTYRIMLSIKHFIGWVKDDESKYAELFYINTSFLTNLVAFAVSFVMLASMIMVKLR
jgi:hypothetical protein